jgi:hypothetical protein
VAQERLGHSRAETTLKHYIHLSPHKADAAADAISAALGVKRKLVKRKSTGKKLGKKPARKKPVAARIRRQLLA